MDVIEVRLSLDDRPTGSAVTWKELPAVSVAAPDERLLRDVFTEALSRFEVDTSWVNLYAAYTDGFARDVRAAAEPLDFGIDAGGRLVHDASLRRLTVGDVRRAAESGDVPYDPDRLVAIEEKAWFRTIGPADVAAFLAEHWEFLVPYALSFVYRFVPFLRHRRVRRQVRQWHRQGIHDVARIRRFLARRHEWTPPQVGKLLSLDDPSAARLLKAMGYVELDTGLYVLGQTPEAKAAQKAWDAAETRARYHR